jgi:hypothetical protein
MSNEPVIAEVSIKKPYPTGDPKAREQVRDAVLANALAKAERMHLEYALSGKCWDALKFGRTIDQHDCRNTGVTCLCQCHDLTVSP